MSSVAADGQGQPMFDQAKEYAVKTVQYKGWSTDLSLQKSEKAMEADAILRKFCEGEYVVPRCKLEYQYFDGDLNTRIQHSPGRRRRLSSPES